MMALFVTGKTLATQLVFQYGEVKKKKKKYKNCELAVPGLTTIIFPMSMLTKILMVVN